ncbi:MAG TPA: hypothetical protein VFP47_10255, partial [Pyrinomonadaceae bacterium]|nr:hypothetical protein [Pyrinomonadaceae bacterium]
SIYVRCRRPLCSSASGEVDATLDLWKSLGTQLRGHFEDFFRTIVVTQDLHGLITVSVPQNNSVF